MRNVTKSENNLKQPHHEHVNYNVAMSPNTLIKHRDIHRDILELNQLTALPEPHFQCFYVSALSNYLSLTQQCSSGTIRSRLQSVINGLKLRRALILPIGAAAEIANERNDSWTYAVFVSLLLYNLAPEVLGYDIAVVSPANSEYRPWVPFNTTPEPPDCYKVLGTTNISRYANPALLPRIINSQGIDWLCRDKDALNAVFELIVSPDPKTSLGALILKAHGVETTAQSQSLEPFDFPLHKTPVKPSSKKSNKPIGVIFRDWLLQKIGSPQDNKYIHFVNQGTALQDPEIFQQFSHEQQYDNWENVRSAFLKLRLHKINTQTQGDTHKIQLPNLGPTTVILMAAIKKRES